MALTRPTNKSTPFAASGQKNTVPNAPGSPGFASYSLGFPPVTMQSIASGGMPPQGKDFNGVLYDATSHVVWLNAGGQYLFDSALATAIGGYSIGMVLQSNDGTSSFVSAVNNNTTDFNSNPSSVGVEWIPYAGATVASNSTSFVFNTDITPSFPAKNYVQMFNTAASGTQIVTLDCTTMPNIGKIVLGLTNLDSGKFQAVGTNGVYVNFTTAVNAYLAYNVTPQGIWTNQVTYGRNSQLTALNPNVNGTRNAASLLLSNGTYILAAYSSAGTLLYAYDPTTKTLGAGVTIASLTTQHIAGLFATSSTGFVLVTLSGVVAGTVSGTTITTGTAVAIGSFANVANTQYTHIDCAPLAVGTYVVGGFNAAGTAVCAQVFTLSGTTVTMGTFTTGPAATIGGNNNGGGQAFIDTASATNALISVYTSTGTQIVAVTVSGTTPTFGALTALGNPTTVSLGGCYISNLSSTTYLVAYAATGAAFNYVLRVITVSGTTITPETAVTSTDLTVSASFAPQNFGHTQAFPFARANAIAKYGTNTFVCQGKTLTVFTVSGTTVTQGTVYNASATSGQFCQTTTGTWVFGENVTGATGTKTFTVSGTTVTAGTTISTTSALPAQYGYSATLLTNLIAVGGTWYTYPLSIAATSIHYPIGAAAGINFGNSTAGVRLLDLVA